MKIPRIQIGKFYITIGDIFEESHFAIGWDTDTDMMGIQIGGKGWFFFFRNDGWDFLRHGGRL